MGIHDYRFLTRWLVAGTPREVGDVLRDPMDLPRWWPAVYRRAEQIPAGGAEGIGAGALVFAAAGETARRRRVRRRFRFWR
jgi:hypothetical protein